MPSPTSSWTAGASNRRLRCTASLYRPSARHPRPQATICVWALLADSEDEARHQALSRERWRLDRQLGRLGPLRWPDEIARTGFSDTELAALAPMRERAFVGTAGQVSDRLRSLARELALDELVVNTWACEPAVRRRSYALLAEAFDLVPVDMAPGGATN